MEPRRVQDILETLTNPTDLQKKLLPLVEECSKLSRKDDLGWALLAKLLYACDQESLRTISSRIQKRLIAAAKQPVTVPLLHFIRAFLIRFPWLKACNEQTLASICSRAVDFTVENCSTDLCRLTSDIYALWTGNKYDSILLKTLQSTLHDEISEEKKKDLLHFKTANQRYLPQFLATVFSLHTAVMERCASGDEFAINDWLDVACDAMAIDDAGIDESIFRWLKTFMLGAKSCAQLAIRRISSFLIDYCRPSEAYYEAVKEYIHLGPNLNVKILFRTLINLASDQMHSQENGKAYAEAVGAVLEQGSYLLNVQDVIQLQQIVCREAFQNRSCRPALSLLNSLLALNHELLPSPIQIAQSIFSGSRDWCEEVRLGRALCCSISRPRIQTIVPQENLIKKLNDIVVNEMQMLPETSQNSTKLALHEELEGPSRSVAVENEDNNDNMQKIMNLGSVNEGTAENVARKREHISIEEAEVKRVRIDSENEQELSSSGSRRSESSISVEIIDEEQVPREEEGTPVQQEKLKDVSVTFSSEPQQSNSDADVVILDENTEEGELTIQQMMTDFVPT